MLKGELVTLRPIRFEDWEKTINWRNDMLIKNSTMSHPFPITKEQEQDWYNKKISSYDNRFIQFSIEENNSKDVIGFIHLSSIDWISRNAYFGVVIGEKENFGKGFGKEAVKHILNYAFKNLNLYKVYAYVIENHPAIKTYQSLGGKVEGTLRNHFFQNGEYVNATLLAWYK